LTIVLGIIGALLAGWFGQYMGWYAAGEPAGFFGAVVGAVVVLAILRLFSGRR
ncbi:MAG: GlsB/YeaQ/YmgE family stress response membrane protein, partial [Stenotrophomonas sp.]